MVSSNDNVIRNNIGQVGSTRYLLNEVLFINHSLLTLHIYAIYKIYNMYLRYIQYILHIRYIIHIYYVCFFSFFRTQPGIEPGHPRTLYPDHVIRNTIGYVGSSTYVLNEVLKKKKEKSIHLLYLLYILYVIYIVYILYAYYISYILHIYVVKSEWYINRTSFTRDIVEPT